MNMIWVISRNKQTPVSGYLRPPEFFSYSTENNPFSLYSGIYFIYLRDKNERGRLEILWTFVHKQIVL